MKKATLLSILFFGSTLLLPQFVHAIVPTEQQYQGTSNGESRIKLENPIKADSVAEVLMAFFQILIQVGAVAVTLAIVYAGFLFVMARGNPEQLNVAKKTLFWTIIGSLILLGAQIIASVIQQTIEKL